MTDAPAPAWTLTLPCTRAEAERLDTETDTLFAGLDPAPVLSFWEAEPDNADRWVLQAYFEGRPAPAIVKAIHALLPSAARTKARVEKLEGQDWVALSQAGLPPISAGRFHVRNSADDATAPGMVDLLIPASRAFGTGQHHTTQGCLLLLERLRATGHRFGNIADIGTGTGLLAFAAHSLWPRAHITASDIDPAAIDVTAENIDLNGLHPGVGPGKISLAVAAGTDHPDIRARAPYDLIIANILAGPLIALAPALSAQLAEGGSLVLAGLLSSQADAVLAAYGRQGLRPAGKIDQDDWPALHLRKRRRSGWRRPQRWREDGASVAPGFGSW